MDTTQLVARAGAIALGVAVCLDTQAASLSETVEKVFRSHPDIEAAAHTRQASQYRVTQARSEFFPTLGLTGTYSDQSGTQFNQDVDANSRRAEAYLRLPVFNGFATQNGLKSAKSDAKASDFEFVSAKEQLALTITQNYLDILRLANLLRTTDRYIKELKQLKDVVDMRSLSGRVANVESAQASSRLVFAQNTRESIRREYQTAWRRHIELTGEKPKDLTPPTLPAGLLKTPVKDLFREVVNNNPQIVAAYHNAKARQADVGVARAELMPSLSLEYRNKLDSKTALPSEFDSEQEGLINLNYEIPLGGGSIARTREASERRYVAKAQHRSAILSARQSFIQVYERLREAHAITARLQKNVVSTKQVVDAYELQFNAGKRSQLDLLSAHNERYQAQSSMITNWYDRTLNNATLLALMGKLRDTIAGS